MTLTTLTFMIRRKSIKIPKLRTAGWNLTMGCYATTTHGQAWPPRMHASSDTWSINVNAVNVLSTASVFKQASTCNHSLYKISLPIG